MWCWLGLGLLIVSTAGCSGSGASAGPTTSVPPPEATRSPTEVIVSSAPEPTGVPGLSSTDPFCAAWATYAGTVQALGVAASFGDLSSESFAALELTAATDLVAAVRTIDATWPQQPTALTMERESVTDKRIGPYGRRAGKAVDALVAAGATEFDLSTLRAAWQIALARRNPQLPVIAVPEISVELQSTLDDAGRAFNSEVTAFASDPSLTTERVATPETDAYLGAHCPDLASSGVGDSL